MESNKPFAAAPFVWSGRSDPEDGPHALRLHHIARKGGETALIGFACDAGVARNKGRVGAKAAPRAIRAAMANLSAPKGVFGFADLGDISVDDDALEAGQNILGRHVAKALAQHKRIIVLGGGHETAYGSYLGLRAYYPDAKIGIINLDAHFDLRLIGKAGPSSGTPFTQIRDINPDDFDYLVMGIANEANTQALFNRAQAWDVEVITDYALATDPDAGRLPITEIISRNEIIYLTVDMDVLPHYQAPGVSASAARGVSFETIERIFDTVIQAVIEQGKALPLIDIVEVSPPHDIAGMTAKTAAYIARRFLI